MHETPLFLLPTTHLAPLILFLGVPSFKQSGTREGRTSVPLEHVQYGHTGWLLVQYGKFGLPRVLCG